MVPARVLFGLRKYMNETQVAALALVGAVVRRWLRGRSKKQTQNDGYINFIETSEESTSVFTRLRVV